MSHDYFKAVFGFSEQEDEWTINQNGLKEKCQADCKQVTEVISGVPQTFFAESSTFTTTDRLLHGGTVYTPTVQELSDYVVKARDTLREKDPNFEARLAEMRSTLCEGASKENPLVAEVTNKVGESRGMHTLPENHNAVIQAASQFNLLEFPGPRNLPEDGITGYIYDRTQGPACAIACAAGTAYRNYLMPTA